jgi:hypothetical protein
VPCTTNSQQIDTLKIHISEIIKYTTEINITHKTHIELIFASKRSPTRCRPRKFLQTIDIVIVLISILGHPRAMAMNPKGRVLGQI